MTRAMKYDLIEINIIKDLIINLDNNLKLYIK